MELKIDNITFGYDESCNVINGLSLTYNTPEIMCILGSNGTGKSTLLQCIIGANNISAGSITLDEEPVSIIKPRDFARKVAYIPQTHAPSFAYKVIDIVTMGRTSHMGYLSNPSNDDIAMAHEQLTYLSIDHLAEKPYTEISGGERQLVLIAAALTQDPQLMILDEPTAHLDFGNQYRFIELVGKLRDKGMGVLMTTHFPDHALMLDCHTAIMSGGRIIAEGQAAEVITDKAMTQLYDIEVHVEQIAKRTICIPGALEGFL